MGSFWGHMDEGIFFILLSLWWMFNCYTEYIITADTGRSFYPKFSYPLPGKRRIPLEIYLKIAFLVFGFMAEVLDGGTAFLDDDGNFIKLVHMQHMTIYGIFLLHSITDLFVFFNFPLIPNTHYLTAALSFIWYGIAFYFHAHMHGKEPLEMVVHVLPVPVMLATAVTVLLEMLWRRGVATMLIRTYFVLNLGTWFSHVAFLLYEHNTFPGNGPSSYDRSDHRNASFAVAAFGMHLCFNLIFMVLCYIITYYALRWKYGIQLANHVQDDSGESYKTLPNKDVDEDCREYLLNDI